MCVCSSSIGTLHPRALAPALEHARTPSSTYDSGCCPCWRAAIIVVVVAVVIVVVVLAVLPLPLASPQGAISLSLSLLSVFLGVLAFGGRRRLPEE